MIVDCQITCDACRLLEADDRWRVQLHTVEDALTRLRPEWDRLLRAGDSDLFFLHNAWQTLWWRHFGDEHLPRLVTVRDECGRLAGIAPLMAARADADGVLRFIGGTEVADYLDLVVEREHAAELREVLLRAVRAHLPWHSLDLHCLPEGSGTPAALEAVMAPHGIAVARELEDVCPALDLAGSWDGYLATLNKKDRHELRRKLRRAVDDLSATWRTVRTEEDLAPALDAFLTLHRRSSPAKAEFMTERMAAYFRDLAAMTLARGWLRMGVLWAGDIPVSTAMGFAYGDRFYLYNSGFDPAHAMHSVGIAAVGLLLKEAAEEGLAIFDFLQGNEPYKYTLGGQDHPVYRAIATRGTA